MTNGNKIKKNILMQIIYQIIMTITPLIISPYLSRTLGAEALGNYSYSYSIVNYFMLFSMLGFINYGTRAIASSKSSEEEKEIFWSIYYLQLLSSLISSVLYLFLLIIDSKNTFLYLQFFWLLSCFFDVTWYFFGKENFKITVIRNIIYKILTIMLIFIFVKQPSDLNKYILIMSLGTLVSQFSLWIIIIKNNNPIKIQKEVIIFHIKPVFVLFVPILAMSVYHIMDKTMLGLFSSSAQSGYYYNADKIINIPLCIFTGIGTVMLPAISSLLANNETKKAKQFIRKSILYFSCFSIALAFGLYAISTDFVPFFFGKGYDQCINLIKLFAIVLVFKSLSDVIRTQYMIPFKKEKIFIISVIFGAIVNFICNFIFIKVMNMGAIGAALGTIIAEFIVCFSQIILIKEDFNVLKDTIKIIQFVPIGFIMLCVISFISHISVNYLIKLFLEIMCGGIVYVIGAAILLYIKRDEIIMNFLIKFKKKGKSK